MKKKLLSTLTAVAMLSSLVTPVMAAKPSHHGDGHYSYATGQEGYVTEAEFLSDSYNMKNGASKNYLDELMAYVNDSLLAHELRYVEWYIENHDSNYPFSLDSTTSGVVTCGFDSGSATLTAIVTRNDGSLVKASTKLVAQPKVILYATGFYFEESAYTMYTGAQSITGGEYGANENVFNRVTIKATPDNAVFSQEQYEAIESAILNDGDLNISLRSSTNVAFSDGYVVGTPDVHPDSSQTFNGYTGHEKIYVDYPVYETAASTTNGTAGYVAFEIDSSYLDNANSKNWLGQYVGDVEIVSASTNSALAGNRFIEDLVYSLNQSSMYTAKWHESNVYHALNQGDSVFVEITMETSSASEHDELLKDIAEVMEYARTDATSKSISKGSNDIGSYGYSGDGTTDNIVGYAVDAIAYTFNYANGASNEIDDLFYGSATDFTGSIATDIALIDNSSRYQIMFNGAEYTYGSAPNHTGGSDPLGLSEATTVSDNSTDAVSLRFQNFLYDNARDQNLGFLVVDKNDDGKATNVINSSDLMIVIYDNDAGKVQGENAGVSGNDYHNDSKAISNDRYSNIQQWSGVTLYVDSESTSGNYKQETDVPTSSIHDLKGTMTFTAASGNSKNWAAPSNFVASTNSSAATNSLQGYTENYGTTQYDYTLSVSNFRRYQGTQPAEFDDVARSVRINSNVAVQPTSLNQTSAITVTVGDVMDISNHFKPNSTTNVWWDWEVNEAYFNNDSSYAYNDYGTILKGDEDVLGVREGKNKIVASLYNSYSGNTHYAEVIVTVVPRTGTSTTVTPTSNPLAITPMTHTTTLGGAGVQLTPTYYGESTFDVNDNVLPTLQSDNNGKIEDIVKYKSNDPTVLAVTEDGGFVTPVGVGTGTVTAYIPNSNFESTFTMTVIAPTIPQEETTTNPDGSTSTGTQTPVPSTGANALGQLF